MNGEDARRQLDSLRYRPLWSAARARLERTGLALSSRPITVDIDGDARTAIAGLVGVSPAGTRPLSVRLDRLDESLRTGAAAVDLVTLLEEIDGPLVDRRAVRVAKAELLSSSWQALVRHSAVQRHPGLVEWMEGLRTSGTAVRLAGSADDLYPVVARCLDVLGELPADGVPLAVFAASLTGDAHALDRSTVLGSLAAGAVGFIEVAADDKGVADAAAFDDRAAAVGAARRWRDGWARVGVICDDVSASVLVLNLDPLAVGGPVSSAIAGHRRAGLPLRLTLQQLQAEPLEFADDVIVRSCENPSVVVHAAAALGVHAAPLMCTDGQANSAVDELMRQVRDCGAAVAHHGDFDWGGITIANALVARHRVEPWRFGAADYLDVVDFGRVPLDLLRGPVAAVWDPNLAPAMQAAARCVFEEQVLPTLIDDLRR